MQVVGGLQLLSADKHCRFISRPSELVRAECGVQPESEINDKECFIRIIENEQIGE